MESAEACELGHYASTTKTTAPRDDGRTDGSRDCHRVTKERPASVFGAADTREPKQRHLQAACFCRRLAEALHDWKNLAPIQRERTSEKL